MWLYLGWDLESMSVPLEITKAALREGGGRTQHSGASSSLDLLGACKMQIPEPHPCRHSK